MVGLVIPETVHTCAPGTSDDPPLRVRVTVCPLTLVANAPSMVEHVPLVAPDTVNPEGNVTLIFPLFAMLFCVVNAIVTSVLTRGRTSDGVTAGEVSVAATRVSALTASSLSIMLSALVNVAKEYVPVVPAVEGFLMPLTVQVSALPPACNDPSF